MTAIDDRTDLRLGIRADIRTDPVCEVCHCAHEGCDAVICRGLDLD